MPLRPFDKASDSHDRVMNMLDNDDVPGAGWSRAGKFKALVAGRIAAGCPASPAGLISAAYADHADAAKMADAAANPENYRYVRSYDGDIGVYRSDAPYLPPGAEPLTGAVLKEHAVSRLVQKWAGTSNDHSPVSLAIQEAAITEFGLKGTAPWEMNAELRAKVDNLLTGHGAAYRAFLRTQYELTQEDFKNRGITSLNVIRGMKWVSSVQAPEWAKNAKTGKVVPAPPLRPLSSWTVNPKTAVSFAKGGYYRVTIAAELPVKYLLSWPRSGYGCLGEYEVVALAGAGEVRVRSAAQPKLPHSGAGQSP